MANLLRFHKIILEKIHDPSTSELLIIARGLGLRRIVCKLLQIYDSPQNLVLLVNASQEEESGIGEELGVLGCRNPGLRIVGFETGKKDRQDLYKRGGLLSVTSQIFTVDMLNGDIPTHLITGILVLHAEKVTPTSAEAFIVRLYREKNQTGFLKALSDQPEHITSGLSPLRTILKELQIRTVHIYPRFHVDVKASLDMKRPDVVELDQDMTEAMAEIHHAIVQCMTITLSELKRANSHLDLDELNVDNAYFRSFDMIVRRILHSEWHKVGPRTKQLVNDLATLRRLLNYLVTYDALAFHAYLETLIESNTTNELGNPRQNQSPWMLTDAANVIFQYAKRRCYTSSSTAKKQPTQRIEPTDDEEAWAVLDDLEGTNRTAASADRVDSAPKRPHWLPQRMDPVLEEQPKWSLLADVLQEIEEETMRLEPHQTPLSPGTNTVLIMTSSVRTCGLLREFLSSMDPKAPRGQQGRKMMENKLRLYLYWKSKLEKRTQDGRIPSATPTESKYRREDLEVSEALQRKDREKRERAMNRRRVRGGAPAVTSSRDAIESGQAVGINEVNIRQEAGEIAEFLSTQNGNVLQDPTANNEPLLLDFDASPEDYYGLLVPEETVIVRTYSDDTDDQMLQEIQPRFIVMYEPNLEFVRRIEVYRNSNPGLGVRVYFLMYKLSCEEGKYLTGLRREKESFERLIKERGSMLMPIFEEHRSGSGAVGDALIKTISTRIAGGRKDVTTEPSRVIVDIREFRSSLPSLLHASQLLIIPATLTIGDYILTPDICVERKSIPDLISSFNSGRLYTQCEMMSTHYKQPVLLIEFEEDKSFSLEAVADVKSYAKAGGKYATKKKPGAPSEGPTSVSATIQSKLVLLTLTFPRVRIIWSSSPYATADIFRDLKANNPEPDVEKAIVIGAEDDPDAGAGVNAAAAELLRTLPGITAKNVKHVMNKVGSVRQLCELSLPEVQEILGVEPGKACWEFIHLGERKQK
ncbi:hypothetical protein OBBRIDRAFT_886730 [Obba rivulosa]|uniref:ERCC4 domain-containing protein n=1 Tax=Obba rivulosa TaxID=1052685 RepID=A0A8E2B3Q3_9APHY|nr:hypothetical protein OBBRIDRAFT_886730 [Obba rivulosa]